MTFLHLLSPILAFLLLAAHFYRAANFVAVLVSLFTALCALVFQSATLRAYFRFDSAIGSNGRDGADPT